MTPEQRYEALSIAPGDQLELLADRILASGVAVEVVSGPEPGTMPVRLPVPGTTATTAVIGHVALTRCVVTVSGVRGDGNRPGRDLSGALAAAVCDAEAERGGPMTASVEQLARAALAERGESWQARARAVELTRVQGDV